MAAGKPFTPPTRIKEIIASLAREQSMPVMQHMSEPVPPELYSTFWRPGTRVVVERELPTKVGTIEMFRKRGGFSDPFAAAIAGIAADTATRMEFDRRLDSMWDRDRDRMRRSDMTVPEVVVGAGLHAAIYCATRVAMGHPKPLVIERSKNVGGTFAMSRMPSFFLNSRNKPGTLGFPGQGALNVLPASPVQPADLSADEYQRNSDLALVIRTVLACCANVVHTTRVFGVEYSFTGDYVVRTNDFDVVTNRVIDARGIGNERKALLSGSSYANGKSIMTFSQFMRKFDSMWPLKDMKRVAVIGIGDSGKCAIEALCGQGPAAGLSVASLDWVQSVDWYGDWDTPQGITPFNCQQWEQISRSRYKGIGRLLPRTNNTDPRVRSDDARRVRVLDNIADMMQDTMGGVVVNGIMYDCAILCTGYVNHNYEDLWPQITESKVSDSAVVNYPSASGTSDQVMAKRVRDEQLFIVGPNAKLPISTAEATNASLRAQPEVPENSAAIFRYAERTARLAKSFS